MLILHWLLCVLILKIIFSPFIFFMMKKIMEVHRDKSDYAIGNPQIIADYWGALIKVTLFSLAFLSLLIENQLTIPFLVLAGFASVFFGLFLKILSIRIGVEIKSGSYLHYKLKITRTASLMRFIVRFAASRIIEKTIKIAAQEEEFV